MNYINKLKENNDDLEWYPTTDEIIDVIISDIQQIKISQYGSRFNNIRQENHYNETVNRDILIDSFIDIGAGDGRVLSKINNTHGKTRIKLKNKYAIELAKSHSESLIKNNVNLVGRDFFDTVLIDSNYDVAFSNPPYSIFKEWVYKILDDVNSEIIYLVIPERWKNDLTLKSEIHKKGDIKILGNFDFLNGERVARAKVDLIKITRNNNIKNDTFTKWVENNIGEFKENEKIELDSEIDSCTDIKTKENDIKTLVENYNDELQNMMQLFNNLGKLDFTMLKQLGVTKDDIINKIKSDIRNLKKVYWNKTFDTLKTITEKLTYKKRHSIIDEIQWFTKLDYNEDNIYTIILWIIENYNNYTKQQMCDAYQGLTDFRNPKSGYKLYKSNVHWGSDTWRYNKENKIKYQLDYRVIKAVRIPDYIYEKSNNLIEDLTIVANSMGFTNNGTVGYEMGVKHIVTLLDGTTLFEYKLYQNGNCHFKFNQKFLLKFNIEVGKINNWIKTPKDITKEFDLDDTQAVEFFNKTELMLMTSNNVSDMLLLN